MWFAKRAKIEVFVRHCHFSSASSHKRRPKNFSREKCHHNLLATIDSKRANLTFLLDTFYPAKESHFIHKSEKYPLIEIQEGTEAGSFLKLLDIAAAKKLDPDTIVYFLEDDYLHKEGWTDVLLEGFSLPGVDYVTLYDHRDKYFLAGYQELQAKVFHTNTCHFRTTPSTTNTFATRYKTLLEHLPIHREFSLDRKITADHAKFCKLKEVGATLVSSIPGYSTHCEPEFASPGTDWDRFF